MAIKIGATTPLSVFQLRGQDENSATYALGWVLAQSIHFRNLLANKVFQEKLDTRDAVIELQKHDSDGGFTDLEMKVRRDFHFVLEAKRWWDVPSVEQMRKYQPRLVKHGADRQRLVSVSAADSEQAMWSLPKDIGGIPITHISWRDLQRLAREACSLASSFEEKLWLRQLIQHFQEFVFMERITDNQVYVVALNTDPINPRNSYTWVDVVEKDAHYFHPVGNTWPVQPPNYIAFRYHGKLQSVHHIEQYKVVRNLAECNPLWCETTEDHFVYHLGPPMRPPVEVRSGNIRNRRLKCAIDTLLSGNYTTIGDAYAATSLRIKDAKR